MALNKLSILLQKDGLSFLVTKDEQWIASEYIPFDQSLILKDNLDKALLDHIYLKQSYDGVKLCTLSQKFILVPHEYYAQNQDEAHWLGFDAEVEELDTISKSELPNHNAVLIYAVDHDFVQFGKNNFDTLEVSHAGEVFLAQFEVGSEKEQVFINFHQGLFELAVVKEQKLHLYNIFEYTTKEDVLYHILNVLKQLNLDSNTVELYYYGLTQEKDTLKMMMNFIRHVIPATSDLQRMENLTLIENL